MRVDFVITELFVGGAERCLTELAVGLASEATRVRVFSLGPLPEGPQGMLVKRLQGSGISVECGDLVGLRSLPGCYRKLRRWFRHDPPHLCQTFLYHANVLGTHAARAEGIGNCVGGLRIAEPRPLRCLIERTAVGKMARLVCVSEAVRRFAVDRLGAEAPRTRVIPNGVDVVRFAEAEPYAWSQLGWPDRAEVTLFLGRMHPQKGIELLQRQIDQLAPARSTRKLLLVGDGPLRQPLRQWCESVGGDRVQMLGWQPEVAPLLRAARLLILPSHYEGMPNVVLEAMAAGRPVVCSRVEGIEELLVENRQQQTFSRGDDAAMAALAEQLLSDPELADAIGYANRRHVARSFSITAMIDAYRQLYRELGSV